ncbi:hypothetical protein HG536_0H01970 [Torulaspora globosa]|uniref:Sir4 SID domain-containing protein n=1 Tax=Torulaspora globosa TaxID=48254 RepID=A0A7G3ZMT6_9SACH|nr:uncharacterized protein HG536_0H01970 [Torulaspora globosa]QLL34822.1 hypothetical protein HG536_0H01970 [Torulaspora globosa]
MQNDSDSSSGSSVSPASRSSPISTQTIPLLSKLPAAEQSRVSDEPSLLDNRTPPPRQIPLFRFTPTAESWKQKSTSASPSASRPALGIVPQSKSSPKNKKATDQEKLLKPTRIPKDRLLSLLRSKSKVGNFHNVTVNKADMQQLSRSGTTIPEFISVNQSTRVRTAPSEKVTERPGEGGHTNLGELAHEKLTPYEVFSKNRTFTSSVKNLLQLDISNQATKQAPDAKVHKEMPTIESDSTQRSDAVEKPPAAKEETQLPSAINDTSRKIESSVARKRTFDVAMSEDQQSAADAASPNKYFKEAEHGTAVAEDRERNSDIVSMNKDFKAPRSDAVIAEDQRPKAGAASLNKNVRMPRNIEANQEQDLGTDTVSLNNNSKPQAHGEVTSLSKIPSVASLLNNEEDYNARDIIKDRSPSSESNKDIPAVVSHTRTLTANRDAKSTSAGIHKAPQESSEMRNSVGNQKQEQFNKENNILNPVHPTTAKKSMDSGPLMGIAEKWNNALLQEPPNTSSQRQALADLFTKLYQNNMLIKSEDTHSIDGSARSTSGLDEDRKPEHPVEARIVTDIELFTSEKINDKRPNITPRQKPHHLRGAVVIQDTAPPKLAADQQLEEDKNLSRPQLFYLTDSEETSTDNEEQSPKGFVNPGRNESPKAHSSVQRPVSHGTLHENSSIDRPISAGKDSLHQDPEVERRRINRELAIKVRAKFDEKSWFSKSTVMNLVEPGIAKHSSMASHPKVSVTNNICSTENYEHSHAYYYQQLHKRSKLEFIPLRGPLAAEFGKEGKQSPSKVLAGSSLPKQVRLPEKRPGEMWKRSWRALLQTRSILFDFGPGPSSQKSDNLHSKQIAQLRRIFDSEFGTRIASQLDADVEIVISSDNFKAAKAVESILNDPLRASALNKNLRVWSIEKAYQFLENMGINVKEWTKQASATEESVTKATVKQVPISKIPATGTMKVGADNAIAKGAEAKEHVVKGPFAGERVAEDSNFLKEWTKRATATEESVPKATIKQVPASKMPATGTMEVGAEKAIAKGAEAKERVSKEPTAEGNIARKPHTRETITEEPVAKVPAAKEPVVRIFAPNMAPLTKAFAVQSSTARLGVNKILGTKTRIRDTTTTTNAPEKTAIIESVKPAHKESRQETAPTGRNAVQQSQTSVAEIVDIDMDKTDSESDALEEEFEPILREASEQLEKKDKQIEAARKLILALCQDVMKKELEITSLHGKLKVSERQLKEKDKSIEDYTEALYQRELQLRKITKNKRDLANRFD